MEILGKNCNISYLVAKIILAIIIGLVLGKGTNDALAEAEVKEKSLAQLQAELVYNFIDHIEWPFILIDNKLGSKHKNLCIMEDNPVIPHLNSLLKNNPKEKIVISRKHENDYLDDCNILFINEDYEGYIDRLLSKVENKPILTFGNISNFARNGGMVQFTLKNNRVEFILNIKKLTSSQLKISDDILSISDITN